MPFPFTYGLQHQNVMSQELWMSWCKDIMAFRTVTDQASVRLQIFHSSTVVTPFYLYCTRIVEIYDLLQNFD